MKIGYFCYNLSGNGPRTRARDIVNAVADRSDHEVVVLTSEADKVTSTADVYPVSVERPLDALRTARRCFDDADIVHVPINVYQVLFVRAVYRGPLVAGVGPGIQPSRRHRLLGRGLKIDKKIKTHEYDTRWEAFGYDTEVCMATLDTSDFYPYDDERIADLRDKKGISEDEPVMLYVGVLTEFKGARLVDRIAKCAGDELRIIVAGDGPLRETFTDHDDLTYEGFVENRDLPDYYNLADVTVTPRKQDNTSNVGLESIACGTPVVTTGRGTIERLFKDRGTYVWSERTPEALVSTVKELVSDRERYESQRQRGLDTISQMELTLQDALRTHLDVYEEVRRRTAP